MSKYSVGRSSLRQLILLSFLTIIAPSALRNTLAALVIDKGIVLDVCNPASHLVKPVVTSSTSALSVAKPLAQQFLKKDLDREYQEAMDSIHTSKYEWRVVKDIPKTPSKPTAQKVLNDMNEQNTLEKLYKDLHIVRHAVMERKIESDQMKFASDKAMFTTLEKEVDKVIDATVKLLPPFKVKVPVIPNYKPPKMAGDKTEHLLRNWLILHDYIIVLEFTNDVARQLLKKYCGLEMN